MIQCEKCGLCVLEVKCPLSSAHSHPYEANLQYLLEKNGSASPTQLVLKHNYAYFAQTQGQMAVTGAKWADFFVYSTHGHHLECLTFDVGY